MKTNLDEQVVNETTMNRARWMIVDDNPELLEVIASLLATLTDAELCRFNSPSDALKAFAATPDSFQFVVTDYQMPGMNGLELCREMLAIRPDKKILLSTGSRNISCETARQAGFCGLLQKPFQLWQLRGVLDAVDM